MTDEIIRQDEDAAWRADGERYGWQLSHLKAAWPWRVWGVRHVRFAWLSWRVHSAAASWASVGIGFGGPNQRDLWVLYAIRRGWA